MSVASFLDPTFIKFWYFCNIVAFITWILTLINKNFSQIDRLWSILPVLYSWGFVISAILNNPGPQPDVQVISENLGEDIKSGSARPGVVLESDNSSIIRLVFMSFMITIWGCRLTYNFWRKGGYQRGSEDYRWEHVKIMFSYPTLKWQLFNFGFIAFFQSWLLMGLTLPFWFIQTNKSTQSTYKQEPFNWLDLLLTLIWLTFFIIEVVADRQQFRFQTSKYKYLGMSLKQKKLFREQSTVEDLSDYKRGFITTGLFRYSRHPNFFGELGMWWTIAGFTISSQLGYIMRNFNILKVLPINYGFLGIICLTMLFHASTNLTEKISSGKYVDYTEYKSKVSRIIFGLPGKMNAKKID